MPTINLSANVADRSAKKHKLEQARAFLDQHGLSLRSPTCRILCVMAELWRAGGGELCPGDLADRFGLVLSDLQLEAALQTLSDCGLVEGTIPQDQFDDDEEVVVEYELSAKGIRLASELEWMLSREMWRD